MSGLNIQSFDSATTIASPSGSSSSPRSENTGISVSSSERSMSISQIATEQLAARKETATPSKIEQAKAVNEADEDDHSFRMAVCTALSIVAVLSTIFGLITLLALTAPAWVTGLILTLVTVPVLLILCFVHEAFTRYKNPVQKKMEEINDLLQQMLPHLGIRQYPTLNPHFFRGKDSDLEDLKQQLDRNRMDLQAALFHPAYPGRITKEHCDAIGIIQEMRLREISSNLESFAKTPNLNTKQLPDLDQIYEQYEKEISEWYKEFWKLIKMASATEVEDVNSILNRSRTNIWAAIEADKKNLKTALESIRTELEKLEEEAVNKSLPDKSLSDTKKLLEDVETQLGIVQTKKGIEEQLKRLEKIPYFKNRSSKGEPKEDGANWENALKYFIALKEDMIWADAWNYLKALSNPNSETRRLATECVASTDDLFKQLTQLAQDIMPTPLHDEPFSTKRGSKEIAKENYYFHDQEHQSVVMFINQYNDFIKELEPLTGAELSSYQLSLTLFTPRSAS